MIETWEYLSSCNNSSVSNWSPYSYYHFLSGVRFGLCNLIFTVAAFNPAHVGSDLLDVGNYVLAKPWNDKIMFTSLNITNLM